MWVWKANTCKASICDIRLISAVDWGVGALIVGAPKDGHGSAAKRGVSGVRYDKEMLTTILSM
jgi:hypothetical protein